MWAGPHTDLLSTKSMFIHMHVIDSADESTLCSTVQWHEYTCSGIGHIANSILLMTGGRKEPMAEIFAGN